MTKQECNRQARDEDIADGQRSRVGDRTIMQARNDNGWP